MLRKGMIDETTAAEMRRDSLPKYMLLQEYTHDYDTHVWVSEQDAARRDYSHCWATYTH